MFIGSSILIASRELEIDLLQNPKVVRIGKEFRVDAFAKVGNQTIEFIKSVIVPTVMKSISHIDGEEEIKEKIRISETGENNEIEVEQGGEELFSSELN